MSVQAETDSLVFRAAGFVARSLQIAADIRLPRAWPTAWNPARLSLILNAHWNHQRRIPMTRHGKMARWPHEIGEQVNVRRRCAQTGPVEPQKTMRH
jgi:hypothetical protein